LLKTPLKCQELGHYLISSIPAHLAATQLQHFNLVHPLFLLATKNVLYKLLNKSFITILYFCRFFGLSSLNYTVLSSTMTNPPLPQLPKEREIERDREEEVCIQLCKPVQNFSTPGDGNR